MIRGRKNPLHLGLPARLKAARKAADVARQPLSLAAGLASTAVQRIEQERRVPGVDTVEMLAIALSVSPCWLAYGESPLDEPIEPDGFLQSGKRLVYEKVNLAARGLGRRLRRAREQIGWNRTALAELSGLNLKTILNIEEGRTLARVNSVESLAKALGISPCWLGYGRGGDPAPRPPRLR